MTQITVSRKALHACSLFAASKDDTRRYLQGVYVAAGPAGTRYTAADGHTLIVHFDAGAKSTERVSAIVPTALCTKPKRGEPDEDVLEVDEKIALRLSCLQAGRIDGTYPDVTNVIPRKTSGEVGQFDGSLLARFDKFAMRMGYSDKHKRAAIYLHHNGERDAAVISYTYHAESFGVVMPVNSFDEEWEMPAFMKGE